MTINTTFTNVDNQKDILLNNLEDSNGKIFEEVMLGEPETDFRGFRFPLAIHYCKGASYATKTFNKKNTPEYINSVIGVIVTGDKKSRYKKITAIVDIIQDKFQHDNDWITLNDTVRITEIESSAITIIPTGNGLASIAVFSLKHHVYK